ncbi:MAG: hypothetical protein ACLPYS_17630 [Vulcanimicrobiaceae bacterium]
MTRAIKKGTTATPLITVARSAFKRVGPAQIVHAEDFEQCQHQDADRRSEEAAVNGDRRLGR